MHEAVQQTPAAVHEAGLCANLMRLGIPESRAPRIILTTPVNSLYFDIERPYSCEGVREGSSRTKLLKTLTIFKILRSIT